MQDIHTIKYYSTVEEITNDTPSHVDESQNCYGEQ